MITKITCPSCQTMGQFSVDGGNFNGPYRCWKCRALFILNMANSEVVSLQPLTEEGFQKIKAEQEAEKRGHKATTTPQTTPQVPELKAANPVAWPKITNKMAEENKQPELPKRSFFWPRVPNPEQDFSSSEKPSVASPTTSAVPGEKIQRNSNGAIIFQTIAILVQAEKILYDEGCSIARIATPMGSSGGSSIALRFPWSQYETIKRSLDQSGIQTLEIRQLSDLH